MKKALLFLVCCMGMAFKINATIRHSFVNEFVFANHSRNIDLDNDGTNDFKFFVDNNYRDSVSVLNASNYYLQDPITNEPKAYNVYDTSFGNGVWTNIEGILSDTVSGHAFSNDTNKYLVVKFISGGNVFHGWIGVHAINNGTALLIDDYAWEDIPNQPVLPGVTTYTGINELRNFIFTLFPNPTTDQLHISIDEGLVGEQLNIYNTTGALLQSVLLATNNTQLSTNNLPAGIYIAEIKIKEASIKKRWVKM